MTKRTEEVRKEGNGSGMFSGGPTASVTLVLGFVCLFVLMPGVSIEPEREARPTV